ncbi:recombinase family protein [Vineibacter terrae]|uniref:Recombinase family protein n=1 Tax=Vineibacter terrae TaxID=2586908 RepID=A0A5C8P8D2_9HYPH|nr:recombinase family protein [Vineibacter terrae]
MQVLVQDAAAGRFDIVLSESMDRLSCDQEEIAHVFKRLSFTDIKIVTLSEGPVNELHVGLKGMMGALFLKDFADKTRRALRGRVEAGKSGGGNAYGYEVVRRLDAENQPVRGERKIDPVQAAIIIRIFNDYAAGKSPPASAKELNREGVAGPSGTDWGPSAIPGNPGRGTGILNNELYVGRLVWNRLLHQGPRDRKAGLPPQPGKSWITQDVPHLHIVGDDLWKR